MLENRVERRSILGALLGLGGSALLAGKATADHFYFSEAKSEELPKLKNSDFYDGDGKFLVEKAREAYFAMFARFHYPNPKAQQKQVIATDFNLGEFLQVGLGGVMWINDKEHGFFAHEIYLLPGQMIAEHKHIKTEDVAAKMEVWHVRHGTIFCFGEGPETSPLPVQVPASQEPFRTIKHVHQVKPGEVYPLNRTEAFHFMIGGPEGAIVTEYASYHSGEAIRFANPKVKF
jgi:D-lyxose ketol-isomerase